MTTLTDFLLARIAEDEAAARKSRPMGHLSRRDATKLWVDEDGGYAHVAVMSGRVLAECEAKRRITLQHGHWTGTNLKPDDGCISCDADEPWPCLTIRLLALPYATHPGYRQEWKP